MEARLAADRYAEPIAWGSQIQTAVAALQDAIFEHSERAEAPGGTLNEMVRIKPALTRRVEEQREEHADALKKAEALAGRLEEQLSFQQLAVDQLALEGTILLYSVRLHVMRGGDLLYDAYFQDEGGEG